MTDVPPSRGTAVAREVKELFAMRGESNYGGEAVSQLEHALQAADLAEQSDSPPSLIVAALLHDIGHLLHDLPEDAPDAGTDDVHEVRAARWLKTRFPSSVVAPVALHVAAKRCLVAIHPEYLSNLSPPSQLSLKLQGGPMSPDEAHDFQQLPFSEEALQLREWDDAAKVPNLPTASLSHHLEHIVEVLDGEAK